MDAGGEQFFDSLCRTCMSQLAESPSSDATIKPEQQWQSIFTRIEECGALRIAEVLSNTIPLIEVHPKDDLPKKICCICLRQLIGVYRFHRQCLKSDHELRELISKRSDVLYISSKEDIEGDEISAKELPVEHLISETANKRIEFASKNTLPVETAYNADDPLKIISNSNKLSRNIQVYVNEIPSDEHYAEHSDNETLPSTNSDQNVGMIGDIGDLELVDYTSPSHNCFICNKTFNEPRHLNNHLKLHKTDDKQNENPEQSEIDNFICDICNRNFKKEKSLNKHYLVHDNKTSSQLQSHPCDLCNKTYSSNFTLERHKRLRHSSVQPTIETRSLKNSDLYTPKNNQSEGTAKERHPAKKPKQDKSLKSLSCTLCDKVCKNSVALRHHIRRHKTERVLCPECGKSFSCEGNLKMHLLRHGDAKPYECPHCPRRFPCISDLSNHKKIHEAKRHICHICGSAFTQPYELKNHKKHHSGERPFKCDYCEKRFVRLDQQRRHMRTHTGEKPFKCKYCERAFAQSNDHVKHLRTHLGDNIYRCDLCPLAFRLASLKRLHFATHKNDDEETRERNLKALEEEEAKLAKLSVERLQK